MKTRLFAFLILFALSPLVRAELFEIFGILDYMPMDELINAFSEHGIPPKPASIPIVSMVRARLAQAEKKHDFMLRGLNASHLPIDCISYRNTLDERDDIKEVSVCYVGTTQVAIIPVFDGGKPKAKELLEILIRKYGEPEKVIDEQVRALMWTDGSTLHFGTIPQRYIYLETGNLENSITYIHYLRLIEVKRELQKQKEEKGSGF